MRITYGEHKRAYVKDVRVGEQIVQRIMYNGVQVYPDNETRVKRLTLDMRWSEGTEAGVYWKYALKHSGENNGGIIKLVIGDKEYTGEYEKGVFAFQGEDGPLRHDVCAGMKVNVSCYAPKRTGSNWGTTKTASYTWEEIWLPGSYLKVTLNGTRRWACQYRAVGAFESMPSGKNRKSIDIGASWSRIPITNTYKANRDGVDLEETQLRARITGIVGEATRVDIQPIFPEVSKRYETSITYIE